jgi:uncharacterized protein YjdB
MARLGKNIIILANGIPIAGTKTDSIGSSVEDIETSSPYNGPWKTYVVKRKSWKITTNFLVLNSSALVSGSTGIQDLLQVGGTFFLYVQDFRNNDEGVCGHAILKSVTINAQIDNLVKGKFEFIGNGPLGEFIEVESISLSPQSLLLISGESTTLFPTISPSDATEKRLVWSSSNPSVATVDQDGNVTAVGNGSCTITCAATDGSGVAATCVCNVTAPILVQEITLTSSSVSIIVNDIVPKEAAVSAIVSPDNATNKHVTWTSNSENLIVVQNGDDYTIQAIAAGDYRLTATAQDGSGVSASCYVYAE